MKTLENRIILSTRPISEDDTIKKLLSEKGATVIDFPMIQTVQKNRTNEIIKLVSVIHTFQWLVFTSRNGVIGFFETYKDYIGADKITCCKIAVVGNATADSLLRFGLKADYISIGKNAENLSQELISGLLNKQDKVLLILGNLANDVLEQNFKTLADVTRIDVYETVQPEVVSVAIIERISLKKYDLILFTSPSTVRNFMHVMKKYPCATDFKTACIGKITEKEMLSLGLIPNVIASEPGADTFVAEIENYLLNKN